MSRLYKNAPLIEAICAIRFDAQSPWDLAIPGLLYDRLRDKFPTRKPLHNYQLELIPSDEGLQHQTKQSEILQFADGTERNLIRVGQNFLSVHNIKAYPGWKHFAPIIAEAIKTYVEIAKPTGVERIGLRCINRIKIPGSEIDLEHYFNFYPHLGDALPQLMGAFLVGVDFSFEKSAAVLRLQLASEVTEDPKINASRLDLDYFSSQPNSVTLENLSAWLETAHDDLESVFEAAITDRLRLIFDGGTNA